MFQKCSPPFQNVVANTEVRVSPEYATCGMKSPTRYCKQTMGIYKECDVCDNNTPDKSHPPKYLTDTHDGAETEQSKTWWQSITMNENIHGFNQRQVDFSFTFSKVKEKKSKYETVQKGFILASNVI